MINSWFFLFIFNFEALLHIHFVVFLWVRHFLYLGNAIGINDLSLIAGKVKNSLEMPYLTFSIS